MIKKFIVCLFCLFIFYSLFWAKSYEFIDQNVDEVLFALSMEEGVTIMGDDTVRGRVTFRAIAENFSEIFDLFLTQNRLYVHKTEKLWSVSKMKVFCDDENFVQVDAFDISPQRLFEKVSEISGQPIVFDTLPTKEISVHVSNISLKDFVNLVVTSLGNYKVIEEKQSIRIQRETAVQYEQSDIGYCIIEKYFGSALYRAEISRTIGKRCLEELCKIANKESIFLARCDSLIDTVFLTEKSFEELLDIFCVQLSISAIEKDNVLYFVESQDTLSNSKNFGKTWALYALAYLKAQDSTALLQTRFENIRVHTLSPSSLFIFANEIQHKEIESFLKIIDLPESSFFFALQYIRTKEFLDVLPPGFSAQDFFKTGKEGELFFCGTKNKYEQLQEFLQKIDVPQKQILYDLLVLQVQESSNFSWEPSLTAKTLTMGDRNFISADLGSVLDLQCNILSTLGINFAMKLQTAINESKAKIFADTSLHGLSGIPITFQNTNTYRYKDIAINPETGKPMYTGITREIVSGLFLEIEGWASGSGMITTKVKATVSKRGADLSSSVGNPPPTYEKIISTEVCSKSGETVILSGLIQDDSVLIEQATPLISKIPILGKLFTSLVNTREKTEMLIYLIPHLVGEENENSVELKDREQEKMDDLSQKILLFFKEDKNNEF